MFVSELTRPPALSCLCSPSEELTSEPCDLQVTSVLPSFLPLSQWCSSGHETGTSFEGSRGDTHFFQDNCCFSSNLMAIVKLSYEFSWLDARYLQDCAP